MAKSKAKPVAVILTDTHMDEHNMDTNISVFKQARDLAKSYKFDRVWHAGDIFHSRKSQPQNVLNTFKRILDEFEEDGLCLNLIPGNHDKTDYKIVDSFLDPYQKHPALALIRTPQDIFLGHNITITAAPFFSDAQYVKHLNELKEANQDNHYDGTRVLLTHIGVNGAVMNNGIRVESGIDESLFEDWDKVLIGHYHDAADYGKVVYIGASIQHNFGESCKKGVTVLYDDLSLELIDFDTPKFITYEVNANDITPKDLRDLKENVLDGGKNRVRVILTGDEKKIKSLDLKAFADAGVKVAMKPDLIEEEELISRVQPFTTLSIQSAFKEFCKKNELNHKQGLKYLNIIFN